MRLLPVVPCSAENVFLSRSFVTERDNSDSSLRISPAQEDERESGEAWCGGMMEFDLSTFAGASEALGLDPLAFGAPVAAVVPVAGSDAADLALGLHGRGVDFLYTALVYDAAEIFPGQGECAAPVCVEYSGQNETVLNLHFPSYSASTESETTAAALIQAHQMLING